MARNFRCLLFGLMALSTACVLFLTKNSVLVKNATVQPPRYILRDESDRIQATFRNVRKTPSVDVFLHMNLSDVAGPSSCALCNCFCDGVNRSANGNDIPSAPCKIPSTASARAKPLGASVIILTSMRTGSSFIGEIFGRNDDIFYLFEPGLALLTELKKKGGTFVQPLYVDMLKALYRCNTTEHDFYINWLSRQPPLEVKKKVPRVFDSVCYKFETAPKELKCDMTTHDLFMRKCQEKRNIVIKSIRINDIGMLLSMIEDNELNLKVIHLVRDPRGMTASRVLAMNVVENTSNKLKASSFTDEMRSYLMEYCSHSINNKEVGYYLPKYRNNYYLLRYEDMSLDPQGTTESIYNFTGLGPVPETISKWIAENTQTFKPGAFSTTRVSSKAYQSWRTKLDYATVKAIEQVGRCTEMMKHFGYLPVKDKLHLNALSSSLVDRLPPPHNFERYQP